MLIIGSNTSESYTNPSGAIVQYNLETIKAKRTKSKIRELFKSIEALEGNPTRFVDI